jgi:hypothetical protein
MMRPLVSVPTPADYFDIAVRRAMNDRKRALADAASLRSGAPRGALEAADSRFRADVKAAADEYAAALIEAHARSPRSQQDPRQQNGAAS